jgi:hypothetical protein
MKVIGVIGYSDNKCKTELARGLVEIGILEAAKALGCTHLTELHQYAICSGLTNLGIPALAYEWAKAHSLFTIGIACSRAVEHSCYPVDETLFVGDNWGDESGEFLARVDALVQVGGGDQSFAEAKAFKALFPGKPLVYFPLNRDGTA